MLYFASGMTKELSIEEQFAFLLERIEYLQSENDRLKERLARYENPKNSKNSSKPPSSDFPKLQRIQSLREPSGKKPGGQFGHEGTTLKMVTTPNIIEDHSPFYCTCCGEDLSSESGLFSGRRQVIDIQPIVPIVIEHQLFDKPGHFKMGKLLLLLSTQTGDMPQLSKSCRRVFKTMFWSLIAGLHILRPMRVLINFVLLIWYGNLLF